MGINIHQLPADIANQIAAGEVIERPASVEKELLENACDAGADRLLIEIGYGGLNLVRISDNGLGIAKDDLVLALAAHATSKITKLEDLYNLHSMGFRGEALASIASISKCTIESRTQTDDNAHAIQSYDKPGQVLPCARAVGTTVTVRDIFYNAPVRKKFLKSERSEFQAIEQVVKRFALSQPQIALRLMHNDTLVLDLPAALQSHSLGDRVSKLLGKGFYQSALHIKQQRANMRLTGWISGVDYQRSQQDKQWVYVNQRMVRDKLLNHAIKQAYENVLHPGRHPSCVLYLEVLPSEVDVNVHPTKHEVRFVQPRLVHDFIAATLQEILKHTQGIEGSKAAQTSVSYHNSETNSPNNNATQPTQVREYIVLKPAQKAISTWSINNEYSIILHEGKAYLLHNKRCYASVCEWSLAQIKLPLVSRPLLVPLVLDLPLLAQNAKALEALKAYGISLSVLSSKQCEVKSIPALLPQLLVKAFLTSYEKALPQAIVDIKSIIAKHVDYQSFAQPKHQMVLQQYLESKAEDLAKQQLSGIRPIDLELCQRVFNV